MPNRQTPKPRNRQTRRHSPGPSRAHSLRAGVGHRAAGFTLIEAALTTVIVGTGVLAIVAAQQAYHQKNDWAQRTDTAMRLANELRELSLTMPAHDPITGNGDSGTLGPEADEIQPREGQAFDTPTIQLEDDQRLDYDDLDDFAGVIDGSTLGSGITFSPVISGLRRPIDDMDRWSQTIKVENVRKADIAEEIAQPLGTTDAMRVTVTIGYRENDGTRSTVKSLRWLVMGQ